MTFSLHFLKKKDGYEKMLPLWQSLYATAGEHPFAHPLWSKLVLESKHAWDNFRCLAFFQQEKLIALIPLIKKGRHLFSLSSEYLGYGDPLIEPGKEQLFLKGLHTFLKASSAKLTLSRMCEPLFPDTIPYSGQALEYTFVISLKPQLSLTQKEEVLFRILTPTEIPRHLALLEEWEKNKKKRQFLQSFAHLLTEDWAGLGAFSQAARVKALVFLLWQKKALFLYWAGGEQTTLLSFALQEWGVKNGYSVLHIFNKRGKSHQKRDLYYTTLYAIQKSYPALSSLSLP